MNGNDDTPCSLFIFKLAEYYRWIKGCVAVQPESYLSTISSLFVPISLKAMIVQLSAFVSTFHPV
jgi:hypothetical protein